MKNPPFLSGYRMLKLPIVDSSGASVWPELFPGEKIDEIRQTVGMRHFSAQMMLEYISEEKIRFDPAALRFYDGEFDFRKSGIVNHKAQDDNSFHDSRLTIHDITGIACYWDPSSARAGADSSVVVLVLRDDKTRNFYIHDIKYLKTSDDELHPFYAQCNDVLDFMAAHNIRHIGIEVNGIGITLPEILRNISAERNMPIVINKITNSARKDMRILDAIEPLLGTGRLWAHERVRTSPLLSEMEDWSPAATINHDGGLDALAGALRAQPTAIRPRGMAKNHTANINFKI